MKFESIGSLGKKVLKAGLAIGLAAGAEAPVQAENFKSFDKEKDKLENTAELTAENPSSESYDAFEKIKKDHYIKKEKEERLKNPLKSLLNDIKNSEIVKCSIEIDNLWTKNNEYDPNKLVKILTPDNRGTVEHEEALKTYLKMIEYQDSVSGEIKKLENKQNKLREGELDILAEDNLKAIYEKGPMIIESVENVRKKLFDVISSRQYLEKLQLEFNCSLDEAKKHQEVRFNNLKNVDIVFKSSIELKTPTFFNNPAMARYNSNFHQIELPYDLSIDKISELAIHELIHSIVMGDKGLSVKAVSELNSSADKNEKYSQRLNNYFISPAERYVRLKMLELELDKLGIKKFGEKISKSGYKKMIQWLEESKDKTDFSIDGVEFLETTKDLDDEKGLETLNNLFEEIADNQENDSIKKDHDYRHPAWNYNNPDNLA